MCYKQQQQHQQHQHQATANHQQVLTWNTIPAGIGRILLLDAGINGMICTSMYGTSTSQMEHACCHRHDRHYTYY